MIRHVVTIGLAIIVCFTPFGCSPSKVPFQEGASDVKEGSVDRLSVILRSEGTNIESDEFFYVGVRVENSTATPQAFQLGDERDQWTIKTDKERIWGVLCFPPGSSIGYCTEKLGPGESYERTLQILLKKDDSVMEDISEMQISLQVGFTPIDEKKTYWSNKVVLGIKPGKHK